MSKYERVWVCMGTCICTSFLILLFITDKCWECYRGTSKGSSWLLWIVLPSCCYVSLHFQQSLKFSPSFDDDFPGKFFFSPFLGEGRGSNFVRIISKRISHLEMCNVGAEASRFCLYCACVSIWCHKYVTCNICSWGLKKTSKLKVFVPWMINVCQLCVPQYLLRSSSRLSVSL